LTAADLPLRQLATVGAPVHQLSLSRFRGARLAGNRGTASPSSDEGRVIGPT
jgi:hypothetical protein